MNNNEHMNNKEENNNMTNGLWYTPNPETSNNSNGKVGIGMIILSFIGLIFGIFIVVNCVKSIENNLDIVACILGAIFGLYIALKPKKNK